MRLPPSLRLRQETAAPRDRLTALERRRIQTAADAVAGEPPLSTDLSRGFFHSTEPDGVHTVITDSLKWDAVIGLVGDAISVDSGSPTTVRIHERGLYGLTLGVGLVAHSDGSGGSVGPYTVTLEWTSGEISAGTFIARTSAVFGQPAVSLSTVVLMGDGDVVTHQIECPPNWFAYINYLNVVQIVRL